MTRFPVVPARAGVIASWLVLVAALGPASAAPPLLSADASPADIADAHGSGSFGTWIVDDAGLPAYRYEIDQTTSPIAPQVELAGRRDAWHQIGNDRIVANAYNHGTVQLWSQDRLYQWVNRHEPEERHHTGGFGYLHLDGEVVSSLYLDRPAGATTLREFGIGYFRKVVETATVRIEEVVYAPFGDDPLLLHDVTIRNRSGAPVDAAWWEYWDVNPVVLPEAAKHHRGLLPPTYDPATRTLAVAQLPDDGDLSPLTIFAAALDAPVAGFETDVEAFFGDGTRARPAAVAADTAGGSIAPLTPSLRPGRTLFAFRSPVSLEAGESVTLRYAYGTAHADAVPALVAKHAAAPDPLAESLAAWKAWLPRAAFAGTGAWLARELQWSAYMVRSGATFEEECGHHVLSQGGYYQYDTGLQIAVRDPLQHMLPMIYAEPGLAREVLRYSARLQPIGTGILPYGVGSLCRRIDLGTSNDLDFWLLLSAVEYVEATRDFAFLDEVVPYADAGEATMWEHLKLAHRHQEVLVGRGPHGGYVNGLTGDWSDFSTQFLQMTESMLVPAQLAYVYPRLAGIAEARGDAAFAAELRQDATEILATLDREWTGLGWFSRGYSGDRQLGRGAIFLEPQPWALLAGAADPARAATLVANIRRFLTGVDAPASLKGPAKIGSAQSPAYDDPEVTERALGFDQSRYQPGVGALNSGSNNAVWVGGVWYALNGPLVWALGDLDGVVANARAYAWDEFLRNTLAAHATAYPDHWDGLLSVDDVCHAHYQNDPSRCGTGLTTAYNTQILHQPAWSLFDAVKLAGLHPTPDGYRIAPRLRFEAFSLRLPVAGIAAAPGSLRGYLRAERDDVLAMEVYLPGGVDPAGATVWIDGAAAAAQDGPGTVSFELPVSAGSPADWAVTWPTG